MSDYQAKPPLLLGFGANGGWANWLRHCWLMVRRFVRAAWQSLLPFNPAPEKPTSLSIVGTNPTPAQVEQCQWIYDQCESRRSQLEQKAQWAFAIVVFVIPVLASSFAFFLSLDNSGDGVSRTVAVWLIALSAALLFLGFLSVVRALAVRHREALSLDAVVDPISGDFRTYDAEFHAKGLLHCASINTAMNDHLAQFIRGGHILTSAAVVALVVAAIPAGVEFARYSPPIDELKVVGPVDVHYPEGPRIAEELKSLRETVSSINSDRDRDERFQSIERRIETIEKAVVDLENSLNNSGEAPKPKDQSTK